MEPCPRGWERAQCALCVDDDACVSAAAGGTGSLGASCSRNLTFAPNSIRKAYSCELPADGLLAQLIKPGTLLLRCATGLQPAEELPAGGGGAAPAPAPATAQPAADGGLMPAGAVQDIVGSIPSSGRRLQLAGAGLHYRQMLQAAAERHCNISFTVASPVVADVFCKATDCFMNPGTAFVECADTNCMCPGALNCGNGGWVGRGWGVGGLGCPCLVAAHASRLL